MNELATVERNTDGTFLKGTSGNAAGRPPGTKNAITALKQNLELALREGVKAPDVAKIIRKMCDMAADGNVGAAKLILDKVLSNAKDTDDAPSGETGWTFVIKNVTIQNDNSPEQGDIIDVTPEEG